MLFNSLQFLIFLPIVVLVYYLIPYRFRWILVFCASCIFYMVFVPYYVLILFGIILNDFFSGIMMEDYPKRKKYFLLASIGANLAILGFFKYFNFFNQNVCDLFSLIGFDIHPSNWKIVLPIGLSFHTFQSMSYTIEVYRGNQKAERHLGYFANYVLFFPQMVAGPIERYSGLGNELKKNVVPLYENLSNGFRLVLFGLLIKMCIADNIAPYVNEIYNDPTKYSSYEIFLGIVFFSFQIYTDFFGYSTIALGSAKMLGISIMDNFKTPYLASSISEFWNRWHISLSTWFRDYVYFSLGGNHVKLSKWSINILIVFAVSGLWHGANWTFVIWGLFHGLLRISERLFKIESKNFFINGLLTLKTFLFVSFAWIFFRAPDFGKVKEIFYSLFFNNGLPSGNISVLIPLSALLLMVLCDALLFNSRIDLQLSKIQTSYRWGIYTLMIFVLMALSGTQKFAFIYFQF